MNAHTRFTMDPTMRRRAQEKAAELGISLAEYMRRLVARDLGETQEPHPNADISIVFDLGESDEPTDMARDKDKLIGEAVWEEYLEDVGDKPRQSPR